MKRHLLLVALLALAGCSTPAGGGATSQLHPRPAALVAQASTQPRYEYQSDVEYTDEATPFLHLVEVPAP